MVNIMMLYSCVICVNVQDMSLDEFHRELIAKSHDLFPSLTEEDLKPYLLRSRATNAYDAITLLAKSVGAAFTEQSGDNCIGAREVGGAVETIMVRDCS